VCVCVCVCLRGVLLRCLLLKYVCVWLSFWASLFSQHCFGLFGCAIVLAIWLCYHATGGSIIGISWDEVSVGGVEGVSFPLPTFFSFTTGFTQISNNFSLRCKLNAVKLPTLPPPTPVSLLDRSCFELPLFKNYKTQRYLKGVLVFSASRSCRKGFVNLGESRNFGQISVRFRSFSIFGIFYLWSKLLSILNLRRVWS
jgi:hypothetical protein